MKKNAKIKDGRMNGYYPSVDLSDEAISRAMMESVIEFRIGFLTQLQELFSGFKKLQADEFQLVEADLPESIQKLYRAHQSGALSFNSARIKFSFLKRQLNSVSAKSIYSIMNHPLFMEWGLKDVQIKLRQIDVGSSL